MVDVNACHHEPETADFGRPLVRIVFTANHLTGSWFEEADAEFSDAGIPARAQIVIASNDLEQISRNFSHL